MAQYDVHRYARPGSPVRFVLDVQSDLLDVIDTRVVVPLYPMDESARPALRLNPVVEVPGENDHFYLSTAELAAVHRSALGDRVANLAERHDEIIAALDLVFTGV